MFQNKCCLNEGLFPFPNFPIMNPEGDTSNRHNKYMNKVPNECKNILLLSDKIFNYYNHKDYDNLRKYKKIGYTLMKNTFSINDAKINITSCGAIRYSFIYDKISDFDITKFIYYIKDVFKLILNDNGHPNGVRRKLEYKIKDNKHIFYFDIYEHQLDSIRHHNKGNKDTIEEIYKYHLERTSIRHIKELLVFYNIDDIELYGIDIYEKMYRNE